MQLVVHPKVRFEVHAIMKYYERVATPELADDFYSELRASCWRQSSVPKPFPSARATFAASTFIASRIIFFFASLAMRRGFWLSDIIGGIHRRAFVGNEPSPNP